MNNRVLSFRHFSVALCFTLSSASFANVPLKFPNIPAEQIAQEVQQIQNPQTGAVEIQARSFDPFEAVDGLAGTASLRSNSHSSAISGETLSGGAVLDINFFYVTDSDDPYDVAGFETAAFDVDDYADTVFYDNRIVECSGDIHNVVYQSDYYAGASFGLLAGVYRPFPLYRGHQYYNPYGFVYSWSFPTRLSSFSRFGSRNNLRSRLRPRGRSANQRRLVNSRFTGRRGDNRNIRNRSAFNRVASNGNRFANRQNTQSRVFSNNNERRNSFSNAARTERRANRNERQTDGQNLNREPRRINRNEQAVNRSQGNTERGTARRQFRTIKPSAGRTIARSDQAQQTSQSPRTRAAVAVNATSRRASSTGQNSVTRSGEGSAPRSRIAKQPRSAAVRAATSSPKTSRSSGTNQRKSSTRKSNQRSSSRSSTSQRNRASRRSVNRSSRAPSRNSRRVRNFFPQASLFGASSYRVYSASDITRCAREENLSVHISYDRLEAALDTGLTIFVLDRDGQDIPVYIPPNYIEGFGVAAFGDGSR